MPKVRYRWRINVKFPNGDVYYAHPDPARELPWCSWVKLEDMYPSDFTEIEAIDICQQYSEQRPYRYKVKINVEEKQDA